MKRTSTYRRSIVAAVMMNRKGMKLLLLGGVTAALWLAQMTPAVADDLTCFPYHQVIYSPCGEPVVIDGTLCLRVQITTDAAGGLHGVADGTITGAAVGLTTGAVYGLVDRIHEDLFATTGDAPASFTRLQTFLLIGQGGVPNTVVHALLHLTVDANGEFTALVSFFDVECH